MMVRSSRMIIYLLWILMLSSNCRKKENIPTPVCASPKVEASIFPNPAVNNAYLFVHETNSPSVQLKVFNSFGMTVLEEDSLKTKTPFTVGGSFPAGIYIAKIIDGPDSLSLKFILQK